MTVDQLWPVLVGTAIAFAVVKLLVKLARSNSQRLGRMQAETRERTEALFRATFPELQPHFHPKNVYAYARARRDRTAPAGPMRWRNPPGFEQAAVADIRLDGAREKVRLLDGDERELASFVLEEHPEGAVVRVGKGKFTVGLEGPEPRVRYWHPEREFKWTPTLWKMKSGLSDQPLESRSTSTDSWSDGHSSSSSSIATGAAVGAGIVAAGGSFDGGGASASWDDGGSSGSSSGGSHDFSSVESGSSSTSSDSGWDSGSDSGSSTSY